MPTRDINGRRWYVEVVGYPSALMAKRAWERAERKLIRGPGEDGVGVTRLAPNPAGGVPTRADGDRAPSHAVAVVTLNERMIVKALRLLSDGESFEPTSELVDGLIARRSQVMVSQIDAGQGRIIIRRPEERGAQFNQLGELNEPPPGRG